MPTPFAAAAALLIGLLLGMLGGGGSVLTVPVLVYLLGVPAKAAVAMSMPIVGLTSLVGAAGHWRHGAVAWRPALAFGGVAMGAAYAGARLAQGLDARVQLGLLGALMAATSVSMLWPRRATASDPAGASGVAASEAPGAAAGRAWPLAAAGVGVLTGVVGIGGGFLVVPALVLLARVPMRQAIGTSLVVITLNAASGLAGHLGRTPIAWGTVAWFSALAIVGILVGTRLSRQLPTTWLRQGFAWLLLAIAALMLWQQGRPVAG